MHQNPSLKCSMIFSALEIKEIKRSVTVHSNCVTKTFDYFENGETHSSLVALKKFFLGLADYNNATTVRNIEVNECQMRVTQDRVPSRALTDMHIDKFEVFADRVMTMNSAGWVFGDLNYKNIAFDGLDLRCIDFEPFVKVIKDQTKQLRVTLPYFHTLDKQKSTVSSLTDRLGLVGIYLRIKYGFRYQKEIFTNKRFELEQICLLERRVFLDELIRFGK